MSEARRIRVLPGDGRFWVLAQVQGAAEPLAQALGYIAEAFEPRDKIILLGSQIGCGGGSLKVMEQLSQARLDLAGRGEIIWLRGIQEELLKRFYTLHMAPDPAGVLTWMIEAHQFDRLLSQFSCDVEEVMAIGQKGAAALARYTASVRDRVLGPSGAGAYFENCERAVATQTGQLLFVHGGLDPARPLSLQTDAFWWGHPDFFRMKEPYMGYARVISALVPDQAKRLEGPGRLCFDGGAGRGGELQVICLDPQGHILAEAAF